MSKKAILVGQVQDFTFAYMSEALKNRRQFKFSELRDAIKAKFPGAEFNWLTAVRSPMQAYMNDGKMQRIGLSDEIYVAV